MVVSLKPAMHVEPAFSFIRRTGGDAEMKTLDEQSCRAERPASISPLIGVINAFPVRSGQQASETVIDC